MSGGGGGGGQKESKEAKLLHREQAETARVQRRISREQWGHYKQYGLPALQRLTNFRERLPTAAEYATDAGRAGADVDSAYDRAGENLRMSLGRYGVNPMSGRYVGTHRALSLGRAASKAGAMTGARLGTRDRVAGSEGRRFGRLATTYGSIAGIPVDPLPCRVCRRPDPGSGLAGSGFTALAGQRRRSRSSALAGLGQLAGAGLGFYFGRSGWRRGWFGGWFGHSEPGRPDYLLRKATWLSETFLTGLGHAAGGVASGVGTGFAIARRIRINESATPRLLDTRSRAGLGSDRSRPNYQGQWPM